MTWTAPKTWSSEPLTSNDLNTYIRDNQNYLKNRFDNHNDYLVDESADYTTTSTVFVDVDATNLALTVTTDGGDVLVGFAGNSANNSTTSAGRMTYFNIAVDGVDYFGDDGVIAVTRFYDTPGNASFVVLIEGLSAGSHTFKLRWKTATGTSSTLYAGAGTSTYDVHPQFWAQEI